jgi:pimeloyl-ACP methyl ester carboxylesterase
METIYERVVTPGSGIPLILVYEQGCLPRPAVIVLHGTRRSKEIGLQEHDQYLCGGDFVRVYPDAPMHGERASADGRFQSDAPWQSYMRGEGDALREVMIPLVWGMAKDVPKVIDYLLTRPELIEPHFATYGFSVAGLMSLMATGVESRLDAAVTLSAPVRFRFMSIGMTYPWDNESIEEAEHYDPLAYADRFYPTALLMIHGTRDDLVPVEAARHMASRLSRYYSADPQRFKLSEYPHVRHYLDKPEPYVTAEGADEIRELRREARDWLKHFLSSGMA